MNQWHIFHNKLITKTSNKRTKNADIVLASIQYIHVYDMTINVSFIVLCLLLLLLLNLKKLLQHLIIQALKLNHLPSSAG